MPATDLDLPTVDRLLTTTRAVRRRLDLDRPVDRTVVLECLRLAVQAPTGSNLQGWRWVVVSDPDKRAAVADWYRRGSAPYFRASETMIRPDDERARRVYDSARHLDEVMHRVPLLLIPCMRGRPERAEALFAGLGVPQEAVANTAASGFYGSIWPAVWSLMLALRSRGLGSAITTLHLPYEREVGALLGIPSDVTQVGLLPIAHHTGETFRPAARRPVEAITYWEAWKAVDPG